MMSEETTNQHPEPRHSASLRTSQKKARTCSACFQTVVLDLGVSAKPRNVKSKLKSYTAVYLDVH
jgi:hypothetical protein